MLSEETLMKIMCYEKKIAVRILRVRFELNVTEIVAAGILSTAVVKLTLNLIYVEIDNLVSFVRQLLLALTVLTTGVRLYTIVRVEDLTREIHGKITKVDASLDKDVSFRNDLELFALMSLVIYTLIGMTFWCFSCANGEKFSDASLSGVSLTLSVMPLVRAVALKQLIVKRLQEIASADCFDLELIVGWTRQLIGSNFEVNNGCWVQAFFCAITLFLQCLNFLYTLWLEQVEKTEGAGALGFCPAVMVLAYSGLYMVILLLAVYSSRVQDQIDEIKYKLDWAKQVKRTSVQEQEMMSLFTMELAHAKVALSAMGLFEFNRATIVAAVGALISYEMVLIQFT